MEVTTSKSNTQLRVILEQSTPFSSEEHGYAANCVPPVAAEEVTVSSEEWDTPAPTPNSDVFDRYWSYNPLLGDITKYESKELLEQKVKERLRVLDTIIDKHDSGSLMAEILEEFRKEMEGDDPKTVSTACSAPSLVPEEPVTVPPPAPPTSSLPPALSKLQYLSSRPSMSMPTLVRYDTMQPQQQQVAADAAPTMPHPAFMQQQQQQVATDTAPVLTRPGFMQPQQQQLQLRPPVLQPPPGFGHPAAAAGMFPDFDIVGNLQSIAACLGYTVTPMHTNGERRDDARKTSMENVHATQASSSEDTTTDELFSNNPVPQQAPPPRDPPVPSFMDQMRMQMQMMSRFHPMQMMQQMQLMQQQYMMHQQLQQQQMHTYASVSMPSMVSHSTVALNQSMMPTVSSQSMVDLNQPRGNGQQAQSSTNMGRKAKKMKIGKIGSLRVGEVEGEEGVKRKGRASQSWNALAAGDYREPQGQNNTDASLFRK